MASSTAGIEFTLTEDDDLDMTIYQGVDGYFTMTFKGDDGEPEDVTGWNIVMMLRDRANSNEITGELSVQNGRVTIGGVDGICEFQLTEAESLALLAGEGVWDMRATKADGFTWQPQSGKYTIVRAVTR